MILKKNSEPSIHVSLKEIIEGFFGIRHEETPSYSILHKEADYEIREYAGYICAQVQVKDIDDRRLVKTAFMKLARYIFGANKKQIVVPMTAPVIKQTICETIPMAAPVLMQRSDENVLWMSFVMPKSYSLDALPKPDDETITFKAIGRHRAAVLTYSGRSNPKMEKRRSRQLQEWLNKQRDYKPASAPLIAVYDPPWTLSFLRKNEIIIPLKP